MQTTIPVMLTLLIAATVSPAIGIAADGLVRRRDRIDVPAIGDGLCVHAVFQSGMVVQRERPVRVWGWADPGAAVAVSFAGHSQRVVAAKDGSWRVELPPLAAGAEPRRLSIEGGGETLDLENVVVGDVWLLGGQSTMKFEMPKVEGGTARGRVGQFSWHPAAHRAASRRPRPG